jgi:hypothetical protein
MPNAAPSRAIGAALLAVAAATLSLATAAPAQAPPLPGLARLQGLFHMTGTVTVATAIRGEHVGDALRRRWMFMPLCTSGPCRRIALTRHRTGGVDHLVLKRKAPGRYTGKGLFYVPLRCGGRIVRKGEAVPFTVRVRVTTAALVGATLVASSIHATYVNSERINLTDCIAFPGHDAAVYDGQTATSQP